MKGLVALLLVLALATTAYNYMQIQQLRAEVVMLRSQLADQKRANNLLAEAVQSVQQAKDAIGRVDTRAASNALERARAKLRDAAKFAGDKAGPALKWLEDQVRDMNARSSAPNGGAQ